MAVSIESFLTLEYSLARTLGQVWVGLVGPVLDEIAAAVKSRDWVLAHKLLDKLSFHGAFDEQLGYVEMLGLKAMLLGATRLVPLGQTEISRTKNVPYVLGPAVKSLAHALQNDAIETVRKLAEQLVVEAEAAAHAEQQEVAKDEEDLVARLVESILGTGKGLVDVGANLTTSRLVSYGFLSQALESGITEYQVSEVLDRRTCPVCRAMHGRVFRVNQSLSRLSMVLNLTDPAELKQAAPWPRQSKSSVAQLLSTSSDELASNGWGVPPYHPMCRGHLVKKGSLPIKLPIVLPSALLFGPPDAKPPAPPPPSQPDVFTPPSAT